MKVLSLFDGMACGVLALQSAGIEIESYDAFEIDKYAIETATHNFPFIKQHGDVFTADFSQFAGVDLVCGGSPCTYWSIAQKNNRETEASGMGWELFCQYVRAVKEAKPRFFVYENNKSMSKAIRESITQAFGFDAVEINSALLSAQNRRRLYWVGKRNEDGTYSKVNVGLPKDKGILLKDILEAEPLNISNDGKAQCLRATYYKDGIRNLVGNNIDRKTAVAEPVCMRYERSETAKLLRKQYESGEVKHGYHEHHELHPRQDGKTNTLTTVLKDNPICEPVRVGTWPNNAKNQGHDSQQYRIYGTEGKSVTLCGNGGGMGAKTGLYAEPVPSTVLNINPSGKGINGAVGRIDAKTRCLTTNKGEGSKVIVPVCSECVGRVFAVPCEWDESGKPIKAISVADGKTYTVYEVKDGQITIKGKRYHIKLVDGFYIIRKLTVRECMRLQTVPEWYSFPVSDSQAYKMLGNGWTVEVIAHILTCILKEV